LIKSTRFAGLGAAAVQVDDMNISRPS
jgi:hypothetical protein